MSIEDLMSIEGIDENLARKLIEAGIPTVTVLATTEIKKLMHPDYGMKIDLRTANKIRQAARERCISLFGFETDKKLIRQFENRQYLTSGSQSFDDILYTGKGFETQKVYEIYGPEGAGKSEFLHQIICTAYLPAEQGGLGTGSIYIDTERMFSLEKIKLIAQRFKVNYEDIKQNILKSSPSNSELLLYFCETQLEKVAYERGARLFCLDNIATHFQAEYEGLGETLPERQQKINRIIHALKRTVEHTNGVAIYTNQSMKNGKHALGNVVGHEAQVRILMEIKNLSRGLRAFKVVKAIDLPPQETILKLGPRGFVEPKKRSSRSSSKGKKSKLMET